MINVMKKFVDLNPCISMINGGKSMMYLKINCQFTPKINNYTNI